MKPAGSFPASLSGSSVNPLSWEVNPLPWEVNRLLQAGDEGAGGPTKPEQCLQSQIWSLQPRSKTAAQLPGFQVVTGVSPGKGSPSGTEAAGICNSSSVYFCAANVIPFLRVKVKNPDAGAQHQVLLVNKPVNIPLAASTSFEKNHTTSRSAAVCGPEAQICKSSSPHVSHLF